MLIRGGILTVPAPDDEASQTVHRLLKEMIPNFVLLLNSSLASQRYLIEEQLRRWCDEEELDLVVTIGGTLPAPGPSSLEIVPEATAAVLERAMPSLSETMRACALAETPFPLLDRGTAGIRGRTLILNLPAGAQMAALFLESVLDGLSPILSYLQEGAAPSDAETFERTTPDDGKESTQTGANTSSGLDPEEFAAFLARRRQQPPVDEDEAGGESGA